MMAKGTHQMVWPLRGYCVGWGCLVRTSEVIFLHALCANNADVIGARLADIAHLRSAIMVERNRFKWYLTEYGQGQIIHRDCRRGNVGPLIRLTKEYKRSRLLTPYHTHAPRCAHRCQRRRCKSICQIR